MKIEDRIKLVKLKEKAMNQTLVDLSLDDAGKSALDSHIEDFYEKEILGHNLNDDDIVVLLKDTAKKFIRSYKKER